MQTSAKIIDFDSYRKERQRRQPEAQAAGFAVVPCVPVFFAPAFPSQAFPPAAWGMMPFIVVPYTV